MNGGQTLALAAFALNVWALAQIWFAQIVAYPLFAKVGEDDYIEYHRFYARRIPLPTILPGVASLLVPLPMALLGPAVPTPLVVMNIGAGTIGLFVTFALEIPRHNRLERDGRDGRIIAELIRFNWPRTAAMTLQAIASLLILLHSYE